MCTRATVPWGFPKAPRIPVWSLRSTRVWIRRKHRGAYCKTWSPSRASHLSAPAQDNILLMRMTWKGCRRMRMWKPSLPQVFTMYLLAQIRAASRAAGGADDGLKTKQPGLVPFVYVTRFLLKQKSSLRGCNKHRQDVKTVASTPRPQPFQQICDTSAL